MFNRPIGENVPEVAFIGMTELFKEGENWTIEDARNLLLVDFGQASHLENDPIRAREHGIPMHYRCPETLMAPDEFITYSADIWALACTFWDLLGVGPLFYHTWTHRPFNEMIADQLDKLGTKEFPIAWRRIWERELLESEISDQEDDDHYSLPYQEPGKTVMEQSPRFETGFHSRTQRRHGRHKGMPAFEEAEKQAILSLTRAMLVFDPKHRLDIKQVLGSEWMQHWALPALQGPGFSAWPSNIHVVPSRHRRSKMVNKVAG
jgi:serine/threonine protein kinase